MITGLTNSQAWNRYSYVNNRPIVMTDPTGNFGLLIAAAIVVGAAAINTGLFVHNENVHGDGFDISDKADVKDAAVAGVLGAAAGALIAVGGGLVVGGSAVLTGTAATAAMGAGSSMAGSLLSGHLTNAHNQENFNAGETAIDAIGNGVLGAATGGIMGVPEFGPMFNFAFSGTMAWGTGLAVGAAKCGLLDYDSLACDLAMNEGALAEYGVGEGLPTMAWALGEATIGPVNDLASEAVEVGIGAVVATYNDTTNKGDGYTAPNTSGGGGAFAFGYSQRNLFR